MGDERPGKGKRLEDKTKNKNGTDRCSDSWKSVHRSLGSDGKIEKCRELPGPTFCPAFPTPSSHPYDDPVCSDGNHECLAAGVTSLSGKRKVARGCKVNRICLIKFLLPANKRAKALVYTVARRPDNKRMQLPSASNARRHPFNDSLGLRNFVRRSWNADKRGNSTFTFDAVFNSLTHSNESRSLE